MIDRSTAAGIEAQRVALAGVLSRLRTGFDRCRDLLARVAGKLGRWGTGDAVVVPAEDDFAKRAFEAVRCRAAERARERSTAEVEVAALLAAGGGIPAAASPASTGARGWARCEILLEMSYALRHQDPQGMVWLAAKAVALAEGIQVPDHTVESAADLQARAWAELGNAHRVANDLPSAERALSYALAHAERGSGDILLFARIIGFAASLCTAQRSFDKAKRLLDLLYELYRQLNEPQLAGKALVKKGLAAGYDNDLGSATHDIARGLALLGSEADPTLALTAVHSFIVFTVQAGRIEAGSYLLRASGELYLRGGGELLLLKRLWTEGKIAAGLGDLAAAEESLRAVRAGFSSRSMPYTTAIVSLDLAAVWMRLGRISEVKALVEGTIAAFRALRIRREAIAALLLLREAVAAEQASVALLEVVATRLRQLEREPAQGS